MSQTTQAPSVAIPLSPKDRNLVLIGCSALMMFITASMASLLVLQPSILARLSAESYLPISTLASTVGVAIMTPVGGKLGDILGRKTIVTLVPILAAVCLAGIALAPNFIIFLIFRTLLGVMQGTFVAAPFILVNQIAEREVVPKYMGMVASSMALGSFIFPFLAGLLASAGQVALGAMLSILTIVVAVLAFSKGLPALPGNPNMKLDTKGVGLLSVLLLAFVLTTSFIQTKGWLSPHVLGGFALTFILLGLFVKIERGVEASGGAPLIPMSLFSNKRYNALLLVGLCAYFYQTPMVAYGVVAIEKVIGGSPALSGLMTLPRTLISVLLPTILGVWIAKKADNLWKGIMLSSLVVAIGMLPMMFITENTPFFVIFASVAVTGVAESFRAVSITPAAQSMLTPENLASGTALVNFFNTLASVLSSAVTGYLFATASNVNTGLTQVFTSIVVVSIIGALVVFFYLRTRLTKP